MCTAKGGFFTDNFAKEFLTRLDGKIPEEEMKTILQELQVFASGYDIQKKETALIPYEPQIPQCYKVYMVSKKIEGRSEGTLKTYDLYLRDFLLTVAKPLKEITANDIRAYLYNFQATRNVSNRSLDGRRLVINTFLQWCTDEGYISKNPCKQIHPIKYEAKLREPLTGVEMELIRDACQTRREKAIIETCSALFVTDRSPVRALKKEGIESIVRKIGERSGIERRVYPHLIRHTTATDALERGMNVAEVQKILGHEKLDTTMIYAKVCQDNVKYDHKRYIV